MREKDQMLHFRVSKAELDIIRQKMQEVGVRNMGAYLRKMAMDGYCIRLDLGDLKKVVSLMRYASNNLNQYAKKANETGSITELPRSFFYLLFQAFSQNAQPSRNAGMIFGDWGIRPNKQNPAG